MRPKMNSVIITEVAACVILTKLQMYRSLCFFALEQRSSNQKTFIFYEESKNQHLVNI